ncbi:hypothetical protein V6M85_06150 [Sulfolobus tengchongensis]|uniref:Transposase n=1 Tax=Sulfolobus tengchongensis TaxID=207809 RepID=A0AAX4L477_9CREN
MKRDLSRSERREVDLLLSSLLAEFSDKVKELVNRGLLSFSFLPQEIQHLLCTNNLAESFNSLVVSIIRLVGCFRLSGLLPITITFSIILSMNGIISIYLLLSL